MPAATTTFHLPLLASVAIASPCSARWEDMEGDDVTRLCGDCKLHVHNLSEMTAQEAQAFLQERSGACIRLFRRADGTILTRDCPVGVARWRRGAAWALTRVAAAITFLLGGVAFARDKDEGARLRSVQPFRSVCEWLNPTAVPPPAPVNVFLRSGFTMGKPCPIPMPAPVSPGAALSGNAGPQQAST